MTLDATLLGALLAAMLVVTPNFGQGILLVLCSVMLLRWWR